MAFALRNERIEPGGKYTSLLSHVFFVMAEKKLRTLLQAGCPDPVIQRFKITAQDAVRRAMCLSASLPKVVVA